MKEIGKILMIGGGLLLLVGLVLWLGGRNFKWLGRLPGDLHIKKPGISFYFPLTTMVIISLILMLLFWVFRKI